MTEYLPKNTRNLFPSLSQTLYDKPFTYLDSAATTLKPQVVIDTMQEYYGLKYSTVRRGIYKLSEEATRAYESTRLKIASFINAKSEKEIVYTSGTTASINLVAYSFGRKFVTTGDNIVISSIEHHANIVPWQILCEEKKAELRVIPCDDNGDLIIEEVSKLIDSKTKLVCVNSISNSLGTINPIKKIIELAHQKNVPVLIDGAQSAAHMKIDVQELDCDFYAFSGHKIYGPTGIGVLYGKSKLLESMPPFMAGGDMIEQVTFEKTTYEKPPHRFEAGTPAIVEVIGLGVAIDFLETVGLQAISDHEDCLLQNALEQMSKIENIRIIGNPAKRSSIISFVMKDAHPHDIGTIFDREGIAIRTGHHCAMPVMKRFDVPATARVSFGVYNNQSDIDRLVVGLKLVNELFA